MYRYPKNNFIYHKCYINNINNKINPSKILYLLIKIIDILYRHNWYNKIKINLICKVILDLKKRYNSLQYMIVDVSINPK